MITLRAARIEFHPGTRYMRPWRLGEGGGTLINHSWTWRLQYPGLRLSQAASVSRMNTITPVNAAVMLA